jgi:hypothetical protein
MDLFDLSVTLHTGRGYVVAIDAGIRVLVRQNVMGGMAARANGGDDEASFEQTITMDGLGVIFQNMAFVDGDGPELRNLRSFFVAIAAKSGDVHHIGATLVVFGGKDVVLSVAGRATGCEISALLMSLPVQTSIEFRYRFIMTHAAVDR